MYIIVILLTFMCQNETTIEAEETFKTSEYSKAVQKLDYYLDNKDKLTRHFAGEKCTLIEVKPGHRKIK